jgi:hypothetical protein
MDETSGNFDMPSNADVSAYMENLDHVSAAASSTHSPARDSRAASVYDAHQSADTRDASAPHAAPFMPKLAVHMVKNSEHRGEETPGSPRGKHHLLL